MAFTMTFSEFELTQYFTVEKVTRSILPPREVNLLDVPARHGAYFSNSRYGVREITVDIVFKASSPTAYMNTLRFLAYALDIEKPTELVMSDEPDRLYYAILSDKTDMDEIVNIGKGQLTFLCPDPFAYSSTIKTITPDTTGLYTIDNQGTTTTFPTFMTTFTQDSTFLSLTSPDGVILVGTPDDVEKTKVPKTTTILNDNMSSTLTWTNAGNILDAGRQNMGTIAVKDGHAIYCSDYGTGTDGNKMWHGAGVRQDLSQAVKDFTLTTKLAFSSQDGTKTLDGNQKGRIEVDMFSVNGVKIGKIVMRDSYGNYEFNIPEIYVGTGNPTFLESEPKAPSGKKVNQKEYTYFTTTATSTSVDYIIKKFKISLTSFRSLNGLSTSVTTKTTYPKGRKFKVKSKTVTKTVYPEHVGSYNDFLGTFTLSRVGTTWFAEIARTDDGAKKVKPLRRTFNDKSLKYPTEDLAYVVISFLQYETDPVAQRMEIWDMKVVKHNTITASTDVPAIFKAGQVLEIDLASSMVWLDDEPFMTELDIGSTFFPIYEGLTEVKVSTDDPLATHSCDYVERYL